MDKMLYYNTVTPLLRKILKHPMVADVFAEFRLVGGTALSLHMGHRMSVDIDYLRIQTIIQCTLIV